MYAFFADVILIIHIFFVLFIILGQALIIVGWWWGWSWTGDLTLRVWHLVAIGVVVAQVWLGIFCPLTILESNLRHWADQEGYQSSFISDWLQRLFFYTAPPWVFTLAYSLFGLLMLLTWLVYPPRRKS